MSSKQLYLYTPYHKGGPPAIFQDWLNADRSGYDGWIANGAPGAEWANVFADIPKEKFADIDKRPSVFHGKNASKSPDKIFISGMSQYSDLFKHAYSDKRRWEACWRGYYNEKKYYQFFNCSVYNTSDVVYPFAVKGLKFKLRVPNSNQETNFLGQGDDKNYGNHNIINNMWGLWMDINGKYHCFKLRCHGDNRFRVMYGGDVRPKDGDVYRDETKEAWGNKYWFSEEPINMKGKTSDWHEDNNIARGHSRSIYVMAREPEIAEMFFCGFHMNIHHDRSPGSKRNFSYLISNLTPIPFSSPRYSDKVKAVLGAPTKLSDIRDKGIRKIAFWDPDQYDWDWVGGPPPPVEPDPEDIDNEGISGDIEGIEGGGVGEGNDNAENPGVPDAFTLVDQEGLAVSTWINHESWVKITNVDYAVPITAEKPSGSSQQAQFIVIDDGGEEDTSKYKDEDWTNGSTGLMISDGQKFMVRATTHKDKNKTITVNVKVGDKKVVSWKLSTLGEPAKPSSIDIPDDLSSYVSVSEPEYSRLMIEDVPNPNPEENDTATPESLPEPPTYTPDSIISEQGEGDYYTY